MSYIARFTAGFFLLIGFLLALGGIFLLLRGMVYRVDSFASLEPWFNFGVGGALLFQGLTLAAIGEGLWLLTNIAEDSAETAYHLRRLRSRSSR